MYAPVATRFRTYGVDLARFGDDGTGAAYAEAILALPAMAEWTEGRRRRSEGESRHLTGAVPRLGIVGEAHIGGLDLALDLDISKSGQPFTMMSAMSSRASSGSSGP